MFIVGMRSGFTFFCIDIHFPQHHLLKRHFSIKLVYFIIWESVEHINVDLYLDSEFYSIDLFIFLYIQIPLSRLTKLYS